MWVIELNIVGRRFTYRVPDRRRASSRSSQRSAGWRPALVPDPHAA